MGFKIAVDREKCNGCEECLEACTVGVLRMQGGKASPAAGLECQGCESCVAVCEESALAVTDTRVALSSTCLSLLSALDDLDEPEGGAVRPQGGASR
ncbi:MAG: 4Fe-4S binding protein [Thermodesulfobacteriota bacterium]